MNHCPDPGLVVLHHQNMDIGVAGAVTGAAQGQCAVDLEQQWPRAWLGRTAHPPECLTSCVESYYVLYSRGIAGRSLVLQRWHYPVQAAMHAAELEVEHGYGRNMAAPRVTPLSVNLMAPVATRTI